MGPKRIKKFYIKNNNKKYLSLTCVKNKNQEN